MSDNYSGGWVKNSDYPPCPSKSSCFLEDCCVIGEDEVCSQRMVSVAFTEWNKQQGYKGITPITLGKRIAELLATIEIIRGSDAEGNTVDMATGGDIRPAQLLKLLMLAPMDPDQVDEYVHITKARDESKEGIVYKDLVILNKEETKDLLNLNDRT